jgi:hypothetical protein
MDDQKGPSMSFFREYFAQTDDRLIMKWAHYYDIYETELARFRSRPISFLEIGVFKGGSVAMWKAFLHPDARLTFVDIDPACKDQQIDGTQVVIGNQGDPAFLADLAAQYGPFDLVIDDGSHINAHQITSFQHLWPHLADRGLYVVEDCHTSYWPGFGGGFRNEASFIEFSKRLIDRMHSWYTDQDALFPFDPIAKELAAVRFFDSITMIEKQIKSSPPTLWHIQNGQISASTRPLHIRGRKSAFSGKDGT